MNIINLAHGELMMMGAYAASASCSRGAPFWLAAIIAFVAVGIFGAVLEATDRPALLRRGTGGAGRHLGREPCPVAGLPAALWPLHAADPDPPRAISPSANIRFRTTGFRCSSSPRCSSPPFGGSTTARTSASRPGRPCKIQRWRERSGSTRARIYMMTFTLGAALAGLSGALLAPTTIHHALHGPAIHGGPRLHHGRCRRGDQRHRRRGRQQPPLIPRENAGWFSFSASLPRDGRASAGGAHHHQAPAERDLRCHPAASRPQEQNMR